MTEIIVLGNGFDLASGLKSSYSHFMNKRITIEMKAQLINCFQKISQTVGTGNMNYVKRLLFSDSDSPTKNKLPPLNMDTELIEHLTFWDIYLFYKHNYIDKNNEILWYNIESDIHSFLKSDGQDGYLVLKRPVTTRDIGDSRSQYEYRIPLVVNVLLRYTRETEYNDTSLIDFLSVELTNFEKEFKEYINGQLNNRLYRDCSVPLFKKIVNNSENNFYLLNFNYTFPIDDSVKVLQRNIHGNVCSDIIFGIDTSNIPPDQDHYKFTKTYRLLTQKNNDYLENEAPLPEPIEVESITFFGHSLSEADYSYFQSIFDFYNLYGSNIKLIFACKPYGSYGPEDMQRKQADLLTKLIHAYSQTLPNKAHGENLIHKLLVEKRLSIKVV